MFEEVLKAERIWASLSGHGRTAILRKVGHTELFGMTTSDMTLVKITIRFGERLAEAITREMLAMDIA